MASMVRSLMPDGWEGIDLLDVGVGDGYTIRLLKPEGRVTGIDIDRESVTSAKERGIDAHEGSVYRIPFLDRSFGLVTCMEVLEHLEQPKDALKEIVRVLRPGGYVVVTTPIPSWKWNATWWVWSKFGPGRRWETTPHVSDLHMKERPGEDGDLQTLFKELGCKVLKMEKCNLGMVAGLQATKAL